MAEEKHYVLGGWADEDLYRKVKAISERDDRTISWLVCKALTDLVERDERQGNPLSFCPDLCAAPNPSGGAR